MLVCISLLIRAFIDKECDVTYLLKVLNIIEQLLSKKIITPITLMESNFLSAFIINRSADNLVTLFTQSPTFLQVSNDIFVLPGAKSFRPSVFQSITNLAESFPNSTQFVGICTAFFKSDPSAGNMKLLFQEMEKYSMMELLVVKMEHLLI